MDEKTLKQFDKKFGHFLTYNKEEKLITNVMIRDWLKHAGEEKDGK